MGLSVPKVTYVDSRGMRTELDVPVGTSVMKAAVAYGLAGIVAECGGSLACATCHVYVDASDLARLNSASAEESDMLDFTACERGDGSRLSCQLLMTEEMDDLTVRLPERQT